MVCRRPYFESRRTGHRYKTVKELHEYFDNVCPFFDDYGDMVLQCVWTHGSGEVRLAYVLGLKLPKEHLRGSSVDVCRVRLNLRQLIFTVLYIDVSNEKYILIKFRILDGDEIDCRLDVISKVDLPFAQMHPESTRIGKIGLLFRRMFRFNAVIDDVFAKALVLAAEKETKKKRTKV
jgi:hypothetical protein